jgi:hypothetical protein
MYLLTSDWHETDQPGDEYRWLAFDHVHKILDEFSVSSVFILGDLWDRKDRHSSILVNRMVSSLRKLSDRVIVEILQGNHDTPLRGPPYWSFLSHLDKRRVNYITEPTEIDGMLFLPYSSDPIQDWASFNLGQYEALFLHATVSGAQSESGQILENPRFPPLPKDVPIYSGDVHVPQIVGGVTYIGAPHPIHFGDKFSPRMLLIDEDTCQPVQSIALQTIKKHQIVISNLGQLDEIKVRPGDQAQIKVEVTPSDVDRWPLIRAGVTEWARERNLMVSSLSSTMTITRDQTPSANLGDPMSVFNNFVRKEGINDALRFVGEELLKEVLG